MDKIVEEVPMEQLVIIFAQTQVNMYSLMAVTVQKRQIANWPILFGVENEMSHGHTM